MAARTFIVDNSSLTSIIGQPQANAVVDVAGNTVYELDSPTQTPNTLVNATLIPTLIVQDYESQLDLSGGFYALVPELDAGIANTRHAILCDYEMWAQTRTLVQQNPVPWLQQSGKVINAYGLVSIAGPSRDLANQLVTYPGGVDAGYLAQGLTTLVPQEFQGFTVQSQGDLPTFASGYALPATAFNALVGSAATNIAAANPSCWFTAGLRVVSADNGDSSSWTTTKPVGGWPSGHLQDMIATCAATTITDGYVGWWLNFNGQTAAGLAMTQALAGV